MPTQQMDLNLIHHETNGSVIDQRTHDGYVNATQLCKVANKRWHNYLRNETTGHFLRALAAKTRISVSELNQEVIDVSGLKSTWVHPKVAVHLAQWLSADFAVQVSEWVFTWVNEKKAPAGSAKLPHHLDRYLSNESQIPPGYFSILQETALGLFGPLHKLGFDIPKNWVPDISVGKCFCAYLRDKHKINTDGLPVYKHDYLDGRIIDGVKLYPNELLGDYRNWFISHWLPVNGTKYFNGKDPASLTFLNKLPALAAPYVPKALPR